MMQTASAAAAVVEKTEMSNMSYPAHKTNIQHSALFPSDLIKNGV
jgi:hypothetical protein